MSEEAIVWIVSFWWSAICLSPFCCPHTLHHFINSSCFCSAALLAYIHFCTLEWRECSQNSTFSKQHWRDWRLPKEIAPVWSDWCLPLAVLSERIWEVCCYLLKRFQSYWPTVDSSEPYARAQSSKASKMCFLLPFSIFPWWKMRKRCLPFLEVSRI